MQISVLGGISSSDSNTEPDSQLNYKVGFGDTKGMTVSSAWKDSDTIFALVSDQTDWHLLKVDLSIEEVYFTTITVSTGSDFEIIGSALYGSSTEFYYAGYTKSLTDGT